MTNSTILLMLLSVIVAAGLSFYQYFYRAGARSNVTYTLALLRFISIFGLLLLLINPIISRDTYETRRAPLPIVVDNSSSVKELGADNIAREIVKELSENTALQEKFDIQMYRFDEQLEVSEAFDFKGKQTNIDMVAKNLSEINKNRIFPTILISDGNQTAGSDYVYSFEPSNKVFPVILGDTAVFPDLRISRLNVNKYAFAKNKFPVEVFLQYSGNKSITANFSISQGNSVLSRQPVSFSPSKRTVSLNVLLPANGTGLQVYKAAVTSGESEKNVYNNTKNFAVEVIDQRTEVVIVSAIIHPDLGALKRSIETNAQRKVTIVRPEDIKSAADYNVLILYQPTAAFRSVFENSKSAGTNLWIITGSSTDFNFVNQQQQAMAFRMSSQSEDYLASFSADFNLFATENIGFESFPPLQHPFGTVKPSGNANILLGSKIRNIAANSPLLAFSEDKGRRTAFLLGENIWKWRLQSHVDQRSFEKFDIFVDKTIQFLASDNKRKSLVVNSESFYNSGDAIEISAQFFNKNYEFDEKAKLMITVTNRANKNQKKYDMLRGSNSFKANLDGLPAGKYDFTVREMNSNTTVNGYFEILDFDIEKQFVNPDVIKLNQLASQTGGSAYLPAQVDRLVKALLEDESYLPVQKTITQKTPLIDWIWLLVIVIVSLAGEWFTRKYNGML